ncbi:hypothetical protein TBR22_A47370 [Luteitalea sp. TBR-22]|uniref:glycosyltransferase n=1 Tax=Luteitalea sp. TBR-22 TaxID=2802971 RepID=UPI001AF40039|nr:glycosyltransferase [Luteitalea sp. TBR-22]BCS35506.1 hypothetical protein TBR22_A47370 [Luteitalea sp. TBR-22]
MPTPQARAHPRAIVVVLGDIGRSPRMLNHALSLVAHGWHVDLVGYASSTLPAEARVPALVVCALDDDERAPRPASRLGWALRAGWRGVGLTGRLLRVLLSGRAPDVVLVQNPPGIPTLPVAWLAARLRGSRLVIDWHNFTASMLALRLGPRHPLIRAAATVERWAGRRADHNFFVSEAMARHVGAEWSLSGSVFRDRPRQVFRAPDPERRAHMRARLFEAAGVAQADGAWRLVVSPTSWTADEDFGMLLEAAQSLDAEWRAGIRGLAVVATGTGPLRAAFEARVAALGLSRVRLATAWLEADDYPSAVGSADAGLSLHDSTSKLDLPMKVMDLFGAGVPVVALDYGACLAELVQPGVNGLTFTDVPSLVAALRVVRDADQTTLDALGAGARAAGALRWHETWPHEVLPHLGPGPTAPA